MMSRKHLKSIGVPSGSGFYLYRKGHKCPTLHMSEDGTITRVDVDLTLTKTMTVTQAYECLGIGYGND